MTFDFYVWEEHSKEFDSISTIMTKKKSLHSILIQTSLRGFLEGDIKKLKCLGSLQVEPIYEEEVGEYIYSMNALDEALLKRGIDPYNGELPCLNEEECREFTNAIELAEFLKEKIDKYQPTKEENELIEYIAFLKEECKSFEFVDCDEIKQKEFKDDRERKEFLKAMIDRYVRLYSEKEM